LIPVERSSQSCLLPPKLRRAASTPPPWSGLCRINPPAIGGESGGPIRGRNSSFAVAKIFFRPSCPSCLVFVFAAAFACCSFGIFSTLRQPVTATVAVCPSLDGAADTSPVRAVPCAIAAVLYWRDVRQRLWVLNTYSIAIGGVFQLQIALFRHLRRNRAAARVNRSPTPRRRQGRPNRQNDRARRRWNFGCGVMGFGGKLQADCRSCFVPGNRPGYVAGLSEFSGHRSGPGGQSRPASAKAQVTLWAVLPRAGRQLPRRHQGVTGR
jgi:hypothetical protein